MKKIYLLIALFCLPLCTAYSQEPIPGVEINNISIVKEGDSVNISFRADIGSKAVKKSYSLIIAPVFTDNTYSWSLPAIIVKGKKAVVSDARHRLASGSDVVYEGATVTSNGKSVEYRASVPYQEWMEGSSLVLESINAGCCSYSPLLSQVMASDLVLYHAPEPEPEPEPVLTTAEMLAENFAFIVPADWYGEIEPDKLIFDEDRDNALKVYFRQSDSTVREDFGINAQSLKNLMSSIHTIENSTDSRIKAIVIAGFASPEGTTEFNQRLAWNRASNVRKYILGNSAMDGNLINIYNGAVDWQGLRLLVEASDQPWKARVLDILDNTPVWDAKRGVGRHGELMRLEGGKPYRYMYEHFFPQLRQAAYIKVYYENIDNQ